MSQKPSIESMMVLGFAGLFSALLVICSPRIPNRVGDIDYLLPGGLFGVALSVSLWWRKILKGLWKMLAITAAASIAFPIAALLCVGFEYFGPWPLHSPGKGFGDLSNAALFVGGTVGSFLICIAVLRLVRPGPRWTRILDEALLWSLVGGVLSVVGWNLGPWLGMALWRMQHSLNLTLPGDRFEYALVQGRAGGDSLLLVWQMGMGLFLGSALDGQQFAEQREKTKTSTPG